jgi:hypothetical protein
MADVQDSDADSWVFLDSSDDDDAGVRSLCYTSDDEHLGIVLTRRARSPSLDHVAEDDDAGDLFDLADAEEVPEPPPPGPKPLSGLFHHTPAGAVIYSTFDPVLPGLSFSACGEGLTVLPGLSFSACGEGLTVLASARGLVCLRASAPGDYIVANPVTHSRVHLPPHACDHFASGDPAVAIAFEEAHTCCETHGGHYHVVVAFPLGDGIYTYETFSSRTWEWTVAAEVNAVEQVVPLSGVGALGCAFWRTTLGYILCYNPKAATSLLIPAPEAVLQLPHWELGEMNGTLAVTCMDDRVNEVLVIKLHLFDTRDITWSLAGHFEGGCLRNRDHVELLRSEGRPQVVMWDPTREIVVAMDLEGRKTRTIGPLSGRQYYPDFIPFISSSTGIARYLFH